ncbi:hypothetical protein FRC14_008125 [Serendipita sp. 396]|nr:hypothetical protein FRC14_008125 [Serendipita sp. 396]KAG8777007.1 hypothetical protein FRC15_011578 [Serendipita sp. 397]KAG8791531.1 hypothetical protein FRC16_000378 [Serendipita sp. 398]KAG8798566.1 hypothetical protein FRC18_008597 [Serendipita sp. 400]KAG8820294.1 hypothetical protein FRC19_008999 [Serendipita sp. 401]KAG8858490.1 hypothetical protein FRC20_012005 [Serendipita sp. 405]KAG8859408.1 hypothetical protein FRB91_008277 [Serendipita sp. 411]KAG9054929.1 hypothetical prot
MDFINKVTGSNQQNQAQGQPAAGNNNQGGGLMGRINETMGGGQAGEDKEDYLDKTVDFVQERMGGGQQTNESAVEQAKDEQISDAIRSGFKSATGRDVPIQDK